jgi:signal transduction histidine kinase
MRDPLRVPPQKGSPRAHPWRDRVNQLPQQLECVSDLITQLSELGRAERTDEQKHDMQLMLDAVASLGEQIAQLVGADAARQTQPAGGQQAIDLAQLCRALVDQRSASLRGIGHGAGRKLPVLRLDLAAGLPPVLARPIELRRLIDNLLANAIRFTDGGSVTVKLRAAREAGLEVTVEDTGVGIPQRLRAGLFEPLAGAQQASRVMPELAPGRGLGLAICRQLVELLGGAICFESAAGQGTRFHVRLPLERAGAQLEQDCVAVGRLDALTIAGMSHDLRSPLSTVIGLAQLVVAGLSGPSSAEQRGLARELLQRARELLAQVDAVLELACDALE